MYRHLHTTVFLRALCLVALLGGSAASAQTDVKDVSEADAAQFSACLKKLRTESGTKNVTADTFDTYTRELAPDMSVIESLNYQPEFRTPIWDYLAALVDDERVADGRKMLLQWRDTLQRVEAEYGVDAETVVAVWGVESNFGKNFGNRPLLASLATLSCFDRRQSYFRGEFFSALQILQRGDVAPEKLVGSWAGAFGHTQFMPSTYMRIAVDFDGDGKRDLVDSVPDALASTANYLVKSGWQRGRPWGVEVSVPTAFDAAKAGRRNKRGIAEWQKLGVTQLDGSPLPASNDQTGLLLPAGVGGPAFLTFKNFDAIYSYNAAESYALAIAHLADRLRGGKPFATPWPTDDPGLSRAERREVQNLLIQRGYSIGAVDGVIGSATRKAIQDVQPDLGLTPDGRAGRKLLDALRRQ